MLIISDIDGVVANFTGAACAIHGYPKYNPTSWDWYKDAWGMSDEQFWGPIHDQGRAFYQRFVKPYPWTADYLRIIRSYGEVAFATANPLHAGLQASKTDWIYGHLGNREAVFLCYTPSSQQTSGAGTHGKELLAAPDHVLIDDADANGKKFTARGGKSITFPQHWNARANFIPDRIAYVEHALKYHKHSILEEHRERAK